VPLLVLGAGGHARPVIEAIRAAGGAVAGLVDDGPGPGPVLGCDWLGGTGLLPALRAQGLSAAVVAIGDNAARLRLAALCEAAGFTLPPLLHPTALISPSARIAAGVQVMARAVVGPEATLGRLVLINTAAIVEHECSLGEAAHLGPGAVLCGRVSLGARVLVAAGAVVRPGVAVGADALVAPGAAVAAEVAAGARLGGVPARPLGRTSPGRA
jgi:UDP-perosamine 4-acetyltransferase